MNLIIEASIRLLAQLHAGTRPHLIIVDDAHQQDAHLDAANTTVVIEFTPRATLLERIHAVHGDDAFEVLSMMVEEVK